MKKADTRMMKLTKNILLLSAPTLVSCGSGTSTGETGNTSMARIDSLFSFTEEKSLEVMQSGFNAGGVLYTTIRLLREGLLK